MSRQRKTWGEQSEQAPREGGEGEGGIKAVRRQDGGAVRMVWRQVLWRPGQEAVSTISHVFSLRLVVKGSATVRSKGMGGGVEGEQIQLKCFVRTRESQPGEGKRNRSCLAATAKSSSSSGVTPETREEGQGAQAEEVI